MGVHTFKRSSHCHMVHAVSAVHLTGGKCSGCDRNFNIQDWTKAKKFMEFTAHKKFCPNSLLTSKPSTAIKEQNTVDKHAPKGDAPKGGAPKRGAPKGDAPKRGAPNGFQPL